MLASAPLRGVFALSYKLAQRGLSTESLRRRAGRRKSTWLATAEQGDTVKVSSTTPEHEARHMTLPTSPSTQSRPESRLVLIPTSSAFTCLYRSRRGRAHPSVIPSPVIAPSFSSAHPGTHNPGPPGTDRNPNRTKEYDTSSKEFRTERQKQGPTRRPGRQEAKIRPQDSRGKPIKTRVGTRIEPNRTTQYRRNSERKPKRNRGPGET